MSFINYNLYTYSVSLSLKYFSSSIAHCTHFIFKLSPPQLPGLCPPLISVTTKKISRLSFLPVATTSPSTMGRPSIRLCCSALSGPSAYRLSFLAYESRRSVQAVLYLTRLTFHHPQITIIQTYKAVADVEDRVQFCCAFLFLIFLYFIFFFLVVETSSLFSCSCRLGLNNKARQKYTAVCRLNTVLEKKSFSAVS